MKREVADVRKALTPVTVKKTKSRGGRGLGSQEAWVLSAHPALKVSYSDTLLYHIS